MQRNFKKQCQTNTSGLVHLVLDKYHRDLRNYIMLNGNLLGIICNKYSDLGPNYFSLKSLFEAWAAKMLFHLDREEQILFPIILSFDSDPTIYKNIQALLTLFENEHEQESNVLSVFEELLSGYKVIDSEPIEVQRLKQLMKDMAESLKEHIAIENDQIFAYFKA